MRKTVGAILNRPSEDDTTQLCTQSIMGQVIHYSKNGTVIARLWPELQMDAAHQEQVANHIADFSLTYLKSIAKTTAVKKGVRRTA